MRLLVTLIAVAAFWLHMLLGCCAHHSHAATGKICALASTSADDAIDHGHTHGHEHEATGDGASDAHAPQHSDEPCGDHPHNDCHETHCSFIAAGKTIIALDLLVVDLPTLASDAAIAQAAAASYRWIGDSGDHSRLPVRLHLFHQVLLI
jgi:hypothetical protein